MRRLRLALLAGGISSERAVSLMSGDQVEAALDPARYEVLRYDPACDLARLVADASGIDAALVVLHGPFGEDGRVQGFLDLLDIPYQGTGVLGSALAMDKIYSKWIYERNSIPVPPWFAVQKGQDPLSLYMESGLGFPLFVKPCRGGSSIGMGVAGNAAELEKRVARAFQEDSAVLVEKRIHGREITGAVLGNENPEALPIVEIVPDRRFDFFDYEAKYTKGASEEICPAPIGPELTREAQRTALAAHRALGCRGYSRTDMMLAGGEIFVLETNTIPGMTATSLLPQAAREAGLSFGELLDRLIALAMEDKAARETRRRENAG
jgi:D-alanine-D-alanine ligase